MFCFCLNSGPDPLVMLRIFRQSFYTLLHFPGHVKHVDLVDILILTINLIVQGILGHTNLVFNVWYLKILKQINQCSYVELKSFNAMKNEQMIHF